MNTDGLTTKITIFDTTMRDGELTPGVTLTTSQKVRLAQRLDEMGVDVIEVGYPAAFQKDVEQLLTVSKQVKQAIVCGLASSKPGEVLAVAQAIAPALRGRIHIYTPIARQHVARSTESELLELISHTIRLARHHRDDIEWSAFDAPNSEPDFLCRAIEVAIQSGATTVSIPDSLGTTPPDAFSELIRLVMHRVPNIDQAAIAVHCHADRNLAVANSIAALDAGARQIECAINGLGARKGNADLAQVVRAIAAHPDYHTCVALDQLDHASNLVTQFTGISPSKSA